MQLETLYDKIWKSHLVTPETDAPAILYIDLHLIHEVTTPQAFAGLRKRGLKVRRPDRTVAHHGSLDSDDHAAAGRMSMRSRQSRCGSSKRTARSSEFRLYGLDSPQQGIVHVIGPELGLTQPGQTMVCGDSHTSTHGAFGALAYGIGTTEVEQVLATQCLLARKSQNYAVHFDGAFKPGVTAKDMILALIAKIGTGGGTGSCLRIHGIGHSTLSTWTRA